MLPPSGKRNQLVAGLRYRAGVTLKTYLKREGTVSVLGSGPTRYKLLHVSSTDVTQTGLGLQLGVICCLQSVPEKVLKTERFSQRAQIYDKTLRTGCMSCVLQLTTEGRELLRLSIGHNSSQSLLPVLQVTRLQDVMPVFHHHRADQLQDKNMIISSIIDS